MNFLVARYERIIFRLYERLIAKAELPIIGALFVDYASGEVVGTVLTFPHDPGKAVVLRAAPQESEEAGQKVLH